MVDDRVVGSPPPRPRITTNNYRLAVLNEADRAKLYNDQTGRTYTSPPGSGKLTIGIGHNIEDLGLSQRIRDLIFEEDWLAAQAVLYGMDPWVAWLDPVRQSALVDLVFNLGGGNWALFKQTRAFLQAGEFERAVAALRDSRWAQQVGVRAERIAHMLLRGTWPWDP